MTFGDRLAARVAERRSQLLLGLDPDPARLWPQSLRAAPLDGGPARRAAAAVEEHCRLVLDAAGAACVGVKFQLACFERLGAPGWAALQALVRHARDAGLLVIADGKRGDVPVTASAYGQALVGSTSSPAGEVTGLEVDAFTANPLLGRDALAPLVEAASAAQAGVFVLVRTSNPGAADLQDLTVVDRQGAEAGPLWEHIARLVDELGGGTGGSLGLAGSAGRSGSPPGATAGATAGSGTPPGATAGLHHVGAVVGATRPEHLARMRELMPRAAFLLPGVGAQGGRVADLAPAFAPGPAGGLVAASRAIVDVAGTPDPAAAARAAAQELRDRAWALTERHGAVT